MSNYMSYTMFFGYRIDEKFDEIKAKQESDEKFWDGIPEFSLNYIGNKIGYKLVCDCLGKEELYFGVELYRFDKYNESSGFAICYDSLKELYLKEIDEKYFKLFNERPSVKPQIYLISESL